MANEDWLAEKFEAERSHLRRIAYRMLGSSTEAEDAVQEAWLRLSRTGADGIDNFSGWLTTVVARVCLDMLRSRKSRREDPLGDEETEPVIADEGSIDPEREMLLADSLSIAVLVVLRTLAPAERVAFVLHDMFDLPFDEIAPIVGRSTVATRQLASRARRRVQGGGSLPDPDVGRQRQVVEAFIAASRSGDMQALLTVLDPDIILRADAFAPPVDRPREVRGASQVARQATSGARREGMLMLVDGAVAIVVAPEGQVQLVLRPTVADGRITAIDIVADPERLAALEFALLP